MTSVNVYRLKNIKTKKYCWIYSAYSEYERAIKAKKNHQILLEADRAFQTPDDIVLDKKLGYMDKEDTSTINQIIVDDIINFNSKEVMSQRLPELYLSVVDEGTLKKFTKLVIKYPQINLGISETFLEEKNSRANEKINNLKINTPYWRNVECSTSYLLHSLPKHGTNENYIPFNLNKVKVDQDNLVPVFYKKYYPTQFYNPNEEENLEDKAEYAPLMQMYQYIRGLKYKIEDDEPLKVDGDKNDGKNRNYRKCLQAVLRSFINISDQDLANISNDDLVKEAVFVYSEHFHKLLNPITGSIILAAIPAHNHQIKNIVSRIVDTLSSTNNQIINGNALISKVFDEVEAHSIQGMKGRDKKKHEATWKCKVDSTDINEYVKNLPVIIIDDLTTSGNSLKAANEYFAKIGFTNLYDFVFGKSTSSKSILDENAVTKKYDGLVMDLDQTFYDSANSGGVNATYYIPNLISKLKIENIKFVFVTQSSKDKVRQYCNSDDEVMSNLFMIDDKYTTVRRDNTSFYKPSSVTIQEAVRKNLKNCNNILGVGNNENDIMAYRRAGIDTALATWGNPIKNICSTANYILKTENDLFTVLQDGVRFLDEQDI